MTTNVYPPPAAIPGPMPTSLSITMDPPLPSAEDLALVKTDLAAGIASVLADLAAKADELGAIHTVVSGLSLAGLPSGVVQPFATNDGSVPSGWARASGPFTPIAPYAQERFGLSSCFVMNTQTCTSNRTHVFNAQSTGAQKYELSTGLTTTMAAYPVTGGPQAVVPTADGFIGLGVNSTSTTNANFLRRYITANDTYGSLVNTPAVLKRSLPLVFGDGRLVVVGGATADAATAGTAVATAQVTTTSGMSAWGAAVTLPFRCFNTNARGVTTTNGDLYCWFAPSTTSNDGVNLVATPQAFVIKQDGTCVAADAPANVAHLCPMADGRVVALTTDVSAAVILDLAQPKGSQSTAYPFTKPTGLTLSPANCPSSGWVMYGGYLPLGISTMTLLMNALELPANGARVVYGAKV